jgi:glycosyltransferase involved in cell wall biosynthesis
VHDLTWWKYPETSSFLGNNYYKKNMTKALFQSDVIICPSNSIRSEIISQFSIIPNKVVSIPHGNSLPTGVKQKPNKPYFLSIGTVEPRKNLDFYAKAITESRLLSNFDFLHVGRQGWGKLPDQLKSIETNSDQELANLITNATAVVIPSLYEGFGLPVLESHAQAIPVIISNTGALVELSNSSDKIFELGNLESIVDALQHYSQQEIKLSAIEIEKAQSSTWLKSAEKHIEVYVGLLK